MVEQMSPPGGEPVFTWINGCESVKTAVESAASAGRLRAPIARPILAIPTSGRASSKCGYGQGASSCDDCEWR